MYLIPWFQVTDKTQYNIKADEDIATYGWLQFVFVL